MTKRNQTLKTNVDLATRTFNETLNTNLKLTPNEITFGKIRKRELGN